MKDKKRSDVKSEKENDVKEKEIATESDEQTFGLDREELGDEKYIEALEVKFGEALGEISTCRSLLQRLQADFDNYRKRNNSIGEDMKALGVSMVVEKMLTVLDNCDLARKYISDESALTGFNMMERQILDALESFGLKEIEADGKPFDAKTMNAVEREKAEGKEDMVVAVVSRGYTLNGKLLRPAGVKVGY